MEHLERAFSGLIRCKSETFTDLCRYVIDCHRQHQPVERTPLGIYIQETRRLEEILDAYGAKGNRRWAPFRQVIAAAKFASDGLYKALHLKYALPFYRIKPVEGDCSGDTDCATAEFTAMLAEISSSFLQIATELAVPLPEERPFVYCRDAETPPFQLTRDVPTRSSPDPGRTIVNLATSFLNQVESSEIIDTFENVQDLSVPECLPAVFNERQLRRYENEFHTIQAAYDTALAGTDVETQDADLPFLRGHVTMIYHLLEIGTAVAHYYERHVQFCGEGEAPARFLPQGRARFLLLKFSLGYTVRYLEIAQDLCRELLGRYAEIDEITVPAPIYRGFHVRPSSLVAKIVRHYGTDVTISLGSEVCDASSAMDIIRLNERIYAEKRRRLAEDVTRLAQAAEETELMPVLLALLEEHLIVLYSGDIQLKDFPRAASESLAEYANRAVARLLATGKIDIRSNIEVTLRGDIRVLEDVRVLADHGYGEDSFGNNVTLPPELSYLKR